MQRIGQLLTSQVDQVNPSNLPLSSLSTFAESSSKILEGRFGSPVVGFLSEPQVGGKQFRHGFVPIVGKDLAVDVPITCSGSCDEAGVQKWVPRLGRLDTV
ncbi:hypothetical protein MJO29_015312 [Puccinia striiformis f. sp. tritici]|nr:hypothetical protein MJO29_015304 [Puccinia striiformis f. sp. tritici]KAI7936009.1 hypothetical protein MJO29_015312 [Puccinia striiformis f. sp. tritici]